MANPVLPTCISLAKWWVRRKSELKLVSRQALEEVGTGHGHPVKNLKEVSEPFPLIQAHPGFKHKAYSHTKL